MHRIASQRAPCRKPSQAVSKGHYKLSLVLIALTLLSAAAPACAQYDAVTKEARRNPFILVRLAALSLETPAEQGEALAGLVEAELSRGRLKAANKE